MYVGCCYTHRSLPNAQFGNDFAEKKGFEVLCVTYVWQHKLRKGKNALFILPQIFMLFVFLACAWFASFLIQLFCWIFRFISGWGVIVTWKTLPWKKISLNVKIFTKISPSFSVLENKFFSLFYSSAEIWSSAVARLTQLLESLNGTPIGNEYIMLPHAIHTIQTRATLIGTETNSLWIFQCCEHTSRQGN